MTQVVVSDELRDRLKAPGAAEYVEVVDAGGKYVGMYTLAAAAFQFVDPPPEELAMILNSTDPRRYTVEEVLAHLRERAGQ